MYLVQTKKPQQFEFQVKGTKKVYKIPSLTSLPVKTFNKLLEINIDGEDVDTLAAYMFMCDLLDKYAAGATEKMDCEDVVKLFCEWAGLVKASGE